MKINRNDPCPCNSGLKYKKCCLVKLETMQAEKRHLENTEWGKWFAADIEKGQQNIAAAEAKRQSLKPENKN